jgi:hypothetical protein
MANRETGASRNAALPTMDWRFTIPNAGDKLKKWYPVKEEQNDSSPKVRFNRLGELSEAMSPC